MESIKPRTINKSLTANGSHLAALLALIGAAIFTYFEAPQLESSSFFLGIVLLFFIGLIVIISSARLARSKQSAEFRLSNINEELQKKQTFCDSIFETSRDCIKVIDLDCKLTFMNLGGQKLLEICEFAPLKGADWLGFWQEKDRESAQAAVDTAKAGGVGKFTGYFETTQTQTPMWFDVVIIAIRDTLGIPTELLVVSRDVTDRVIHEEAARTIEVELKTLAEAIPQIVWTATPDGNLDYYNQRWFDYTDMNLEQTMGWGWGPVLHPDDLKNCVERWTHAVKTGETYEVEYRFKRAADKQYRWHLGRANPMRDSNGLITRWFGTCTDIHDQKQAILKLNETQAQLEATASKFKQVVSSNMIGIIFWNYNGMITEANDAFLKMVGYTREEFHAGKLNWTELTPTEYKAKDDKCLDELAQKGVSASYEKEYYHKNGTRISIIVGAALFVGQEDNGICFVLDQSEMKQAEKTVQIAEQQKSLLELREKAALESEKLKSEFLANMSHEIRTPINGVIGMTSLLLDTPLTSEQRDYGETIRSSADTLLTLVNDILDLSKAEAGKIDVENINYNLDQVVIDIERTLSLAAKRKGLKLLKSISTDLPPYLIGDPTRLRQVLSNLVNNAIKFTSQGSVTIEVNKEVGKNLSEEALTTQKTTEKDLRNNKKIQLRFEITDTGIGIPSESMDRMFLAFSQADASTTRKFGGTGLGLSICKHLVTLMGGEIGVKSTEGIGSTFWFTLPCEIGSDVLGEASTADENNVTAQRKLRILVAEDNSVNQVIAIKMLEKMGHTAVAVANGLEAFDALGSTCYDLVMMDCQMPELDGYEATRMIRNSKTLECSNIPIIAMTANAMSGDREKCLEAGMTDYLSKPMKAKDLAMAIEKNINPKLKSA